MGFGNPSLRGEVSLRSSLHERVHERRSGGAGVCTWCRHASVVIIVYMKKKHEGAGDEPAHDGRGFEFRGWQAQAVSRRWRQVSAPARPAPTPCPTLPAACIKRSRAARGMFGSAPGSPTVAGVPLEQSPARGSTATLANRRGRQIGCVSTQECFPGRKIRLATYPGRP